jgi:hypothetical protein
LFLNDYDFNYEIKKHKLSMPSFVTEETLKIGTSVGYS